MSSLIDLYLEKLLARMVVDDVQRVGIEKELRSHLEEAAATAQAKGLPREQAVQEAVLAFGQPSVVARQFGIWWGAGWFYFERIALAVLLWFLLRGWLRKEAAPLLGQLAVAGLLVLFLVRSFWNRIEVNGGLRVYRFLRPTLSIPFSAISSVALEKGHLVGWRRIIVEFAGTTAAISTGLRGMRAAGVALETIAGDRIEDRVKQHLGRLRLRLRREGRLFKSLFSATWLLTALSAVLGLPLTWACSGFSPFSVAAALAAVVAVVAQALLHADRSKAGICWILTIAFVIAAGTTLSGLAGGDAQKTRLASLVFETLTAVALIVIWWKGARKYLVGIAFALSGCAVVVGHLLPPFWGGTVLTVGTFSQVMNSMWLPDGLGMVWLNYEYPRRWPNREAAEGDQPSDNQPGTAVVIIATHGEGQRRFELPGDAGDWNFFPSRQRDSITLLRHYSEPGDYTFRSELYLLDNAGHLNQIKNVPVVSNLWIMSILGFPMWSPDGRYLLLALPKEGADFKSSSRLAFLDMQTGRPKELNGSSVGAAARWAGNAELNMVSVITKTEGRVPSIKVVEHKLQLWNIHPAATTATLVREYVLDPEVDALALRGAEYALIETITAADHPTTGTTTFLLKLATGDRVSLPPRKNLEFECSYDWNSTQNTIFYVSSQGKGRGKKSLILANGEKGVVASLDVPANDNFIGPRLSPDCRFVFFYHAASGPCLLRPFPRAEIWDTETGRIIPVRALGGVGGIFAALSTMSSHIPLELPLWSPDGRYIAYEAWQPEAGAPRFVIEAADWGGWVTKHK